MNGNEDAVINFEQDKSNEEDREEEERVTLFMELSKSVKAVLKCITEEEKPIDDQVESSAKLVDTINKVVSHGLESEKVCAEILQEGMKVKFADLFAKFHAQYGNAGEQTTIRFLLNSHVMSKTLEVVAKSLSGDYTQYAVLSHPESSEMILGLVAPLDEFDFNLMIDASNEVINVNEVEKEEEDETNPFIEPPDNTSTMAKTTTIIAKGEENSDVEELKQIIEEQKIKITELTKTVTLDKETIEQMSRTIEEQNVKITNLNEIIAANKELKIQMSKGIDEQEAKITELNETISSDNETMTRMSKKIEEQEMLIQSLRQQLLDMNTANTESSEVLLDLNAMQVEPSAPPMPQSHLQAPPQLQHQTGTNPFDDYNDGVVDTNSKEPKYVNPFEDDIDNEPEKDVDTTNPFLEPEEGPTNVVKSELEQNNARQEDDDDEDTFSAADVRDIKRISIYANSSVRFIEFEFSDGVIASQGTPKEDAMTCYLKKGQVVSAVYGRKSGSLDRIMIKFNNGESFGPFGSSKGPDTFFYYAEDNESMQDVRLEKKGMWSNDPITVTPIWKRYK